jgi:hypothetical protein
MPTLDEERAAWNNTVGDAGIDTMVATLKEDAEAKPAAYMALDMVFRSYMRWFNSARIHKQDPELVRNSLVFIMNLMIMETAQSMGLTEDGKRLPTDVWIGELMLDLRDELIGDLQRIEAMAASMETKGNC